MGKSLGFLITTCDADKKHFNRVLSEFSRLGYPFAVNFDHCCRETKQLFKRHPLFIGGHENDNPKNHFDETHRKYGLAILLERDFDWVSYLDTDEIFDITAIKAIPEILESDADLVWCPCLDFWGDDRHFRMDGPFGPSTSGISPGKQFRDKFYNLKTGIWEYKHADVHAPYFTAKDGTNRMCKRQRSGMYVLHYGIMDQADVKLHTDRWNEVYTRSLGENKHPGFYGYISSPGTIPKLMDYDHTSPPDIAYFEKQEVWE